MPLLAWSFVFQRFFKIIVAFCCQPEILLTHWLTFKSVSAIIPCGFPLHALRQLADALRFLRIAQHTLACCTVAHGFFMRQSIDWQAVCRHRVRIAAEYCSEKRMSATLPFTRSLACYASEGITSTTDLQFQFLCNASADKQRFPEAQICLREVSFAFPMAIFNFGHACLQRNVSFFCPFVNMV